MLLESCDIDLSCPWIRVSVYLFSSLDIRIFVASATAEEVVRGGIRLPRLRDHNELAPRREQRDRQRWPAHAGQKDLLEVRPHVRRGPRAVKRRGIGA